MRNEGTNQKKQYRDDQTNTPNLYHSKCIENSQENTYFDTEAQSIFTLSGIGGIDAQTCTQLLSSPNSSSISLTAVSARLLSSGSFLPPGKLENCGNVYLFIYLYIEGQNPWSINNRTQGPLHRSISKRLVDVTENNGYKHIIIQTAYNYTKARKKYEQKRV